MPLHPQAARFIEETGMRPPRRSLSVAENREAMRAAIPHSGEPARVASIEDRVIAVGPRTARRHIRVRTYRPRGGPTQPCVVYFHGGGWVVGDLDTHDGVCRSLAALADCVVVAVDYRLAPEHPFPAAVEDAVAAVRHVCAHPADYGADPARVAVAGDSAGGNLAAVVCLLARDGGGPALVHQVLVYPVTDTDSAGRASYREFAEGYYLRRDDMEWYFEQYLTDADRADPRVAPLRARDLSGLPPATVITAEFDPLRDEGEEYARRLADAGVPVECRRFGGMFHPFFMLAGPLDAAREAQRYAADRLRAAFGT